MVYPEQHPYDEGYLRVSEIHEIYYMVCGNPQGKPVVFLHGGPGGGVSPSDTVYFDPAVYRIVLFAQRGAGKSNPTADLRENTTWDLVADIERLRAHLTIDKWMVFGGSWGSTLALAYSQTHPDRCKALILRGIFLVTKWEIDWFYQGTGTAQFWPDEWEAYQSVVAPADRHDMVSAYYRLLTDPDDKVSLPAAQAWSKWEESVVFLRQNKEAMDRADLDLKWARAFARIECHYFINNAWMPDGHLVSEEQIAKICDIPCIVVQGRYDMICPMSNAHKLAKVYGPKLQLRVADDSGHSAKEPTTLAMLTEAMDELASL